MNDVIKVVKVRKKKEIKMYNTEIVAWIQNEL